MMTNAEAVEFMAKAGYDSSTVQRGAYVAHEGWRAATAIDKSGAGSSDGGSYGGGSAAAGGAADPGRGSSSAGTGEGGHSAHAPAGQAGPPAAPVTPPMDGSTTTWRRTLPKVPLSPPPWAVPVGEAAASASPA